MAVEQLFAHFKDQKSQPNAVYDPDDPESYEAYLQSLMDDAEDYENSILAGGSLGGPTLLLMVTSQRWTRPAAVRSPAKIPTRLWASFSTGTRRPGRQPLAPTSRPTSKTRSC